MHRTIRRLGTSSVSEPWADIDTTGLGNLGSGAFAVGRHSFRPPPVSIGLGAPVSCVLILELHGSAR